MKIVIEKPDGSPYLTLRKDERLAYVQIHDYDYLGSPIEMRFDVRTIPPLIQALQQLNNSKSPPKCQH